MLHDPPRNSGIRASLGAVLLFLASCGGGEAQVSSVLLITLDTTRADALGCYREDGSQHSPRLDAFALESVLYEEARTVAPLTLPAHTSMMTGLWPPGHGVREPGHHRRVRRQRQRRTRR